MQAVQTNSTTNLLPVVHDYFFNQPLLRPLMNKRIQNSFFNSKEHKTTKKKQPILKIGLIIPFQPCIWDQNKIEAIWQEAMEMAERKMKRKCMPDAVSKLMISLRNVFNKLNFNTHRKGLAIIISEEEESIVYLSFPVKPSVLISDAISWLTLADKVKLEPSFYCLVLNSDYTTLYNFNNKRLIKIVENKNEATAEYNFKKVIDAIEVLNIGNKKPVFVTGSHSIVEQFCGSQNYPNHYYPMLYQEVPFYLKNIVLLVKLITNHWSYWHSKFIANTIRTAKKNRYISHTDAVIQALGKGADGILLIDKRLKHQLQKMAKHKKCEI